MIVRQDKDGLVLPLAVRNAQLRHRRAVRQLDLVGVIQNQDALHHVFLNQSDDVPFMAEFPPDRRQFLLFPFQRLVIGSLLLLHFVPHPQKQHQQNQICRRCCKQQQPKNPSHLHHPPILYPYPRTVPMRFRHSAASSFCRSVLMWASTVRVSPSY